MPIDKVESLDPPSNPDLQFTFPGGTIVLCTPVTQEGSAWVSEHVSEECLWYGNALVIEARYLDSFVEGATNDGLLCEGEQ